MPENSRRLGREMGQWLETLAFRARVAFNTGMRKVAVRIIFGTLMLVVLAGLLWLDWHLQRTGAAAVSPVVGMPLAVLLLLINAAAFVEMVHMADAAGLGLLRLSGLFSSAALATVPFWWQFTGRPFSGVAALTVIALLILLVFIEQIRLYRIRDALRRIAGTVLTVLYLGVGLAIILSLRVYRGMPVLVLFLAAVKSADIAAYFTGTAIGRHKLAAWLSAGKSWEGLIGGLTASAGVSVVVAHVLGLSLPPWQAVIFGVAVGLAGQFGDLCESLLKRSAGVKDSGSLLPEFGGVLDIIDSLLLAAPVAYVLLHFMS